MQSLCFNILEATGDVRTNDKIVNYLDDYFKERDSKHPADPFSVLDGIDLISEASYRIMKVDGIDNDVRKQILACLYIWIKSRIQKLRHILGGIDQYSEVCPLEVKLRGGLDKSDTKTNKDDDDVPDKEESKESKMDYHISSSLGHIPVELTNSAVPSNKIEDDDDSSWGN